MNKTLVLSMIGSMSLALIACNPKDSGDDTTAATANTSNDTQSGDGDGDNETSDGMTGDGDGDPGDGDADTGMSGLTSMGFVPMTDTMSVSECDPFLQDCPGAMDMTEKCVAYSTDGTNWNANKCVAVLGDGAVGDTCTYDGTVAATDTCDYDSYCWDVMDVEGVQQGVCTPFCDGSADDPICPPEKSCLIANEGSINLCVATCDPLLQDCGAGLACFWANNGFNCIFTTQDIPLGEACGYINDCAMGLGCLTADVLPNCNGSACCGSFCSVSEAAACPQMGTECITFFEEGMAPPGYEDVGVCILPGA